MQKKIILTITAKYYGQDKGRASRRREKPSSSTSMQFLSDIQTPLRLDASAFGTPKTLLFSLSLESIAAVGTNGEILGRETAGNATAGDFFSCFLLSLF